MSQENYKRLLEVAEMYRDQMRNKGDNSSLAYTETDKAIKGYYKAPEHSCPHRLQYIKIIEPSAAGCETTVLYCPDCQKELNEPKTDC